ncbi:MAG: M28 family peptidase [Bacteroidetes bacterium]|nr:M28 family peptidase [Bacteroidota bacterium]MBU1373223.1 M28 family peptidase [Bacteroidota bacterium]MBU1486295.1 M28 family peptidase [Bacteroidota bacterium]MBU1759677.1 M28 family peptidase [Bacteroidota bacterium]MBU2267216.1 M28 family peptidase [Bacteroidota bacterium]
MKKYLLLAATLFFVQSGFSQQKSIIGFRSPDVNKQIQTEQKFDASMSAIRIGETIKELSAIPHSLGSSGSKIVAEAIAKKFTSYGFDTKIETYQVLFPTPKTRVLEAVSPSGIKLLLKEFALSEDATSGQAGQLPIYNAWSGDGDVTAELVFVNYGLPEDYDELAKLGIDVKGKIVIAKYGHSWRGIKPKVAYEHGAIGCLIYSDPMDDGYFQGDVYPKGAFKNEYGAQRGSVMDMVIHPGDPLTPNIGSTASAKRLDKKDATTILKIPVMPISYHDAQPLLQAMEGPVAPSGWAGALPFTYHVGPGKTKVHLKLEFDWKQVPCYDVIATIKGSVYPDQWVLRGNHHDAWVNGANDPISGQAAMLDEAKAIGDLLKMGWKPKRTIVYCAWDGEEPGLIGSTEWVEDHAKELQQKAVAYINSDGNGRGFLEAGGSQALEPLMDEISKTVIDPQTNVSVFERRNAARAIAAKSSKQKQEALDTKSLKLSALGSGSDYSSFLQHLGVPSLNIGFSGEDDGGEYHSIYDSFDDYRRFKDPKFEYGLALAQTAGRVVLRLSESDVLPFDFRNLYKNINTYATEVMTNMDQMRESTEVENRLIKTGQYKLAEDPTKTFIVPDAKAEVPYLDFSLLQNALHALEMSSDSLAIKWTKLAQSKEDANNFNKKLYQAEQQLLMPEGLPRRPWYVHAIYAPGFYTGYGVKTLPGVREAIEQRNYKEAQAQIGTLSTAINKLADYLMAAAK